MSLKFKESLIAGVEVLGGEPLAGSISLGEAQPQHQAPWLCRP